MNFFFVLSWRKTRLYLHEGLIGFAKISGEKAWDSLRRDIKTISGESDGPISSFFTIDINFLILQLWFFFLFINSSFISFHSLAIKSFVHVTVDHDERSSIRRNASPCDFLLNDFYGFVKSFFSTLRAIKKPIA